MTSSLLALPLLLGWTLPWASHTPAYPHNEPIQRIVDQVAASVEESLHPKGLAIVVAEPTTGKILGIASRLNDISVGPREAISWIYEPATPFKPVVAVAVLEKGAITPQTKINCENGAFNFEGKTIRDHHKAGDLTLAEVIQYSSNIGASKMALLLKDQEFYDFVRRFGFGDKAGVALPGECQGLVNPPQKWDSLTKSRMAFGQSVGVTPLQLTMAYCVLANGGKLMKPVIGSEEAAVVRRVCSPKVAQEVRSALEATVSPEGTAPLAKVAGVTVAGMAGTSQAISPEGKYYPDKFITSFAGFFPADHPKYVVTVVVDQADLPPEKNYGGLVAAPIFSEIAGKIADSQHLR